MSNERDERPGGTAGRLQRSVGFYGLMFISLGSIIGSGWLLGALNAAERAGPASILSWILAACMLALLALTYAELGAAYPVAGGAARFPYYSHGPIAGFTAGWASWLQAVFVAPIEVLAAITYVNSVGWVNMHFDMINKVGHKRGPAQRPSVVIVAIVLMVLFTAMNLAGAEVLLRKQRDRRPLEDGRPVPRDRRGGRAAVQTGQLPRRRRLHALRLPWRLRRADRRRGVRLARL